MVHMLVHRRMAAADEAVQHISTRAGQHTWHHSLRSPAPPLTLLSPLAAVWPTPSSTGPGLDSLTAASLVVLVLVLVLVLLLLLLLLAPLLLRLLLLRLLLPAPLLALLLVPSMPATLPAAAMAYAPMSAFSWARLMAGRKCDTAPGDWCSAVAASSAASSAAAAATVLQLTERPAA
jgi:hypothetical protein